MNVLYNDIVIYYPFFSTNNPNCAMCTIDITLSCYYLCNIGVLHIKRYRVIVNTSKGTNNKPDHRRIRKGFLIMKNYKVYVKGMYTGVIELLASEVVAVEKDFEIKLVELVSK